MTNERQTSWVHRFTILLAACLLALILLGAAVTSSEPQLPQTGSPASPAAPLLAETASLAHLHRLTGFAVFGLFLVWVIWLYAAEKRTWVRWQGVAILAALVLATGLGEMAAKDRLASAAALFHAYLAQFIFGAVGAVILFTSRSWIRGPEPVAERFSLRSLALALPILVILQIGLGAAYRHQTMGVLTHIFGAFVVAVFILLVGVLAVKQYPEHRALRPAAVTLMSIAGAQVLLGFAAFLTRLMSTASKSAVMITTVSHVVTGALTLAASVILAIQIRRNVTSNAEQHAPQRANPLPS